MKTPMNGPYDLCVDAYVDHERFDPAMLPRPTDLLHAPSEELAVAWRRQWQSGQELRIRFLDGESGLHRRVQAHAEGWLRYANVALRFGKYADAEIRVSFTGRGYWSLVGTDAVRAGRAAATMQLGGFTSAADDLQLRRTVLHEFGHALGCIHEQASPAAAIPWDEPKVYDFYRKWQGWDEGAIYHNVLRRYSPGGMRYSNYDPASIMQYPVPAHLTRGGFEVGWNNDLSEGDKSFIARMYPSSRAPDRRSVEH
jgi:hypothetical protein